MDPTNLTSRRDFLRNASAAASAALLADWRLAFGGEAAPYGGFAMGVQSYCFRKFSLKDAVKNAQELGLPFIEIYPGHLRSSLPREKLDEAKAMLQSCGVTANAYGVCGFGTNHGGNRKLFEFAKYMGMGCISADPAPNGFDSLDRLVKEFDVKIGIHNHGPRSRWPTPEKILEAVGSRDVRIGACIDTGHFARADVDPIDAVRKLGPRVHGVHLKDVNAQRRDVVVGAGTLKVAEFFGALQQVGFNGFVSLEYESSPSNPMPAMRQCLAAVRDAIQGLVRNAG